MDAVEVINGARPIYFPGNNGREPLFIYLLAGSIQLLGHTALAVRLPAAILGSLTVLAAYGLARTLFNPRMGLMVAALTAGSMWAIALSRIGLRASTLPPLAACMIIVAAYGWRTKSIRWVAVSGILCGLCFYTYISARLIPLSFLAVGLFWYSAKRSSFPTIRWLAAFTLPAVLVLAPLALYAAQNPAIYFGRVEQVSIAAQGPSLLFDNLFTVLGMFAWQGDANARHNLPGRPVFDWAMAALFWSGVALAGYRAWAKREMASAMMLVWLATMLLPTALSDKAPHYLRAIGAIPIVFMFPALAADWLWPRTHRWVQSLLVLVLGASTSLGAQTYFTTYAQDERLPFYFQAALTALAEESLAYTAEPEHTLYLDNQLWEKFPALIFLLGKRANLVLVNPELPQQPANAQAARLVARPQLGLETALALWPAPAQLRAEPGALYRNDDETVAYPLYHTFTRSTPIANVQPLADYGAVQLLAVQTKRTLAGYEVSLLWAANGPMSEDLHTFVHLMDDAEKIAQADNVLGGLYPARQWRVGDQAVQVETLAVGPELSPEGLRLILGLYQLPAGERLLTHTQQDAVEVPLEP